MNKSYISLGQGCQMSLHISKLLRRKLETHIFDNMVTNFKTVIEIMEIKKFKQDDFVNYCLNYNSQNHWRYRCNGENVPLNENWITSKELIECKNFPLISPHYIDKGKYNTSIITFTDMMNRRLDRFKNELGKTNFINFFYCANEQFIPHYIPSLEDMKEFHDLLRFLNPKIQYKVNILVLPEHHESAKKHKYENERAEVYLLEYKDKLSQKRINWADSNLNWKQTLHRDLQ